jgi:mannose/cellobiose epimerase-like protein (N-acyl-D-glucosamine 2-epimerase family)
VSERAGSAVWRAAEAERLLSFARGAAIEGGFGWLDDDGSLLTDRRELWINARMTYVFSEAHRRGSPDAERWAAHGVQALLTGFRDPAYGGWFSILTDDGPAEDTKSCYEHAFVVLAGSAAARAGIAGGDDLLAQALEVHGRHFWDDASGRCVEEWSRDWSSLDDYRGANSNMHTVEAYLAAGAVTRDRVWVDRAASIARAMVAVAEQHSWRLVEHFDASWTPLPSYNEDKPRDQFRPYGATPGHGFEWARLLTEVVDAAGPDPALTHAAVALFDRAVTDTGGGAQGFCYTTDWGGRPVVAERFHWVACEAILAADALGRAVPDDPRFERFYDARWRFVDEHFVDREGGSWWHELSPDLVPSKTTWRGKPDVYHAFNACVLPGGTLPEEQVLT